MGNDVPCVCFSAGAKTVPKAGVFVAFIYTKLDLDGGEDAPS